MNQQQKLKHYSKLTFEELLSDDYFISSMNNPTSESSDFWLSFEKLSEEELIGYKEAKKFLSSIETWDDNSIEDSNIDALWSRIESTNAEKPKRTNKKKLIYTLAAVAAAVGILIITLPLWNEPAMGPENIMSFAKLNGDVDFTKKNVQLVISQDKTVELEQNDITIAVDSIGIKTEKQDISKEESAEFNQLIVPRGKRSHLILEDGSKLYVNSGTRVVYPINFSSEYRVIYVDGEVLLDVKKDSKRPFIVRTNDLDVQVLGTKFNVMAYGNEPNKQIVLESGSVRVIDSKYTKKDRVLKESEMFEMKSGTMNVETVDIEKHLSWVKGIYYYKNERLEDIVNKLGRYYGVDIECSQDVSEYLCSGKIDIDNGIEKVLDGLSYVLPLKIKKENERFIIS